MKNKEPRYINNGFVDLVQLENGTLSGEWESSLTSDDTYISFLTVCTDDVTTVGMLMQVSVLNLADELKSFLGTFEIPQNSGYASAVLPKDLKAGMGFLDVDGAQNKILVIPAGYKIKFQASAINAGNKVNISIGFSEFKAD